MTHTIILNETLPSWNKIYASSHWRTRKKIADEWHQYIFLLAKELKIPNVKKAHITVVCTFPGKRMLDVDNVCVKLVIDGLVHAGVFEDDNPQYIPQLTVRCEQAKERETIITIEEV